MFLGMSKKDEAIARIHDYYDKIVNRFYNKISGNRTCSKCKHLQEKPRQIDVFIARIDRSRPIGTYNECDVNGSVINANEIDTKNCRYFKRKYGLNPARQRIRKFSRWSQKQWRLHYKIIIFVVATILSIISILVSILLHKGIL